MRADIIPGGAFPGYPLPGHTGTVRTLSELQGRDPLILTLTPAATAPKNTSSILSSPPSMTCARSPGRSAPGWDLSTQALRGAGAAGGYSSFHGWDKKAEKPLAGTWSGPVDFPSPAALKGP